MGLDALGAGSARARSSDAGLPGGLRAGAAAPPDRVLLLAAAATLCLGLVMVLSASSVTSAVLYHDPYYFFKRQVMWAVLGLGAFFICLRFDYWRWRGLALPAFAGTFALLLAVLVLGQVSHGSQRWISLGGPIPAFQPSELAKLSMVVVLSAWLSGRTARQVRAFSRCALPTLGMVAAVAGLILKEPDLGTAAATVATAVVLLYVVGVPPGQFAAIFGAALPALGAAIFGSGYRRARFLAFLHPAAQAQGGGYHILQALYALGSGGLFGVGLGLGRQKWFYLPEPQTDSIFAVIGEELGFLGALLVLALFATIIWRGYRIAATAPDLFGTLLAAGLTTMLAVQVVVNIGVVSGVLPVTGIPLPLVSFGGSSLLFTMAGLGMLANVSKYCRT